jgi:hypothetical protein
MENFDLAGVGLFTGAIATYNLSEKLSIFLLLVNLGYIAIQLRILYINDKKNKEN